jgi:hypothetical protein
MIESPALLAHSAPVTNDDGLYTISAEFYTEHLSVGSEIRSPEPRLSDLLNSSAPTLDLKPLNVNRPGNGGHVDLTGSYAHVTKSRVLFVIPLREPRRPRSQMNAAWKQTVERRCWAALGPYTLCGTMHTEVGADDRFLLRLLDRQFVPITQAVVTSPDGTARDYGAVIINRAHLDLLTLR